jgi:uncharacterized protein involved in type VI secretion and phage assembly
MALKNRDRELIVATALGDEPDPEKDDPLVLAQVSGAEGISMPYAFNLTMIGTADAEIDAKKVVGRRARWGVRSSKIVNKERETFFVERFGVLETFDRIGTVNGRRVFRGRLVPAFRMTAFEQRNRVFEDRTLVDILREVLDDFPLVDLRHNLVSEVKNEPIPFCVQYNETTFAFIHRLLDRFGISYRFEHDAELRHERMVLSDTIHRPNPVDGPMRVVGQENEPDTIGGFRRSFTASAQNVRLGDFNILNPADPPEGLGIVDDAYAMGADAIGLRAEAFPATGVKPADPDAAAKLRMRKNEAYVVSASGRTRSTGFVAGRQVPIAADETKSGFEGGSWVLKLCAIEAFDLVDDRSGGAKVWDFLKSLVGIDSGQEQDLITRTAEQLRDRVKEDVAKGIEVVNWLQNKSGASDPSGLPGFIADKIGRAGSGFFGGASLLVSSIPSIIETISKAFRDSSGYACAFEAFPVSDPFRPDRWPTPAATRPVAQGPHLALVIGPKGIETTDHDIFTDALGRVRIRFPWDRGPDGAGPDTPAPGALTNDGNTCWVRVSEGWAGEGFGMQFLPRIGQEVLVGFIDGDPERPMIIGRAYNAASGSTHLPFPAQAVAKRSIQKIEDLPATANDSTTRSGIRTKSVPGKGATDLGFHMIRLDDEKGKEQFLLRAERRMDVTTTGSRYDTTRGSQHVLIGGGKPPPGEDSGGGLFVSVGGEEDRTVKEIRYTKVKDDHLTVEGDLNADIGKSVMMVAGQAITLSAGDVLVSASKSIKLMVGSSVIEITPSGIVSKGAIIKDSAPGGANAAPAPDIGEPLGAAEADPGEPPDWLATRPKGKGGKRKTKTMFIKRGPDVRLTPDGKLSVHGVLIDPGPDRDTGFADRVIEDVDKLAKDPARKPGPAGPPVIISKSPPGQTSDPVSKPTDPAGATFYGQPTGRTGPDGKPELGTGKGSPTEIQYNPERLGRADSAEKLGKAIDDRADDARGRNPANSFGDGRAPDPPPGGGAPSGSGGAPSFPEKETP